MRTKTSKKSQLDGRRGKQRPDFTFMCTRIEERQSYRNAFTDSNYQILLTSTKKTIQNCITKYGGDVEEDRIANEENLGSGKHDFLIQFQSVHSAIECAVAIQMALNDLKWPPWFKKFEQESNTLNYSGSGPNRMCILSF